MSEFKRGEGATLVKAVCNALKSARFAPAISQGRPRRSLVVMPFRFAPLDDVPRGLPAVDLASHRRALAEQPRDSTIAYLERAAHCQ